MKSCSSYNNQIKADFNELYHRMNGMPLQEMDKIISEQALWKGSRSEFDCAMNWKNFDNDFFNVFDFQNRE